MASEPVRILQSVRFGDDFELDLRAYELRRSGQTLKLERIPTELLLLLIERRGQLVSRDQIVERVWGKDVFLDTDNSINAAIRKIRQVLKDDPEQPRFVQTLTGRGYRFIAPVEEVGPSLVSPDRLSAHVPAPQDLIGKRISNYRILHLLGGGGMGVVFQAEDLKLGRRVAIKFLPSVLATDLKAFERFEREARAASALDHPNICSIYHLGEYEGQPFIVMQLLEGQTLREWIESAASKPAPERLKETIDLAIEIVDGLECAHQKGIIHRDIKPANIFITNRGHAKILDFGVAKFVDTAELADARLGETADDDGPFRTLAATLTRSGASVGTPSYLSPEQIRREKLDIRSDLFSFGLVLYEMASGKKAFSGDTVTTIRNSILSLPAVPVRQSNPDVPFELERIIDKALEKDPDRRYQSAQEMRRNLERLRGASVSPATATRRRWAIVAAIVGILAPAALWLSGTSSRHWPFSSSPNISSGAALKTRQSVAVLGFKNLSANAQGEWLSTALSEMLTSELAAGAHLRTIPEENVSNLKLQLSLGDAESYGKETLGRIRQSLGSDAVVEGSYVLVKEKGRDQIRLDVGVQNAVAGETIASLTDSGATEDLLDLVSRTGARLRTALGVQRITPEEQISLQASLPSTPEAAQLYAEGLSRMRVFDYLAAHDLLQRAANTDPLNALTHSALASTWAALGYDSRATTEAKKAFDLSSNLSHEDKLAVEASYYDANKDWDKAIEVYKTLFGLFPDDLEYGVRLAVAQYHGGKPKDALATIDALRALPVSPRDDPRLDLAESNAALNLSDMSRALAAAERAEKKARAQGRTLVLARALKIEGDTLGDRGGDSARALAALEEARLLYAGGGDRGGAASILNNIGLVHYHAGNLAEARRFYEESLAGCRAIGHIACSAFALTNIAIVDYDQGKLPDAQHTYQEALEAHRKAGNLAGVAGTLNSIANVLADEGDQAGAKKMYEQSLAACRAINDQWNAAVALGNIGSLLADQGDLAGARQRFEEALQIKRQLGRRGTLAYTISSLGDLLLQQGDLAGSRKMHEEALAIRTQIGQKSVAAEDRLALAAVTLEEGDPAGTEQQARGAADEFHAEKRADNEAAAHTLLARALLAEQKPADAQKEIETAQQLSGQSDNHGVRLTVAITAARLEAALGKTSAALNDLESARAGAKAAGLVGLQLEARLAWGEIALKSKQLRSSTSALSALQKDAHNMGFDLIAKKAAAANGGK